MVVYETVPVDACVVQTEPAQQPRFAGRVTYFVIARALAAVQVVALTAGMFTAAYMGSVDIAVRRGANMDDAQTTTYALLAGAAVVSLTLELGVWETRVRAVLGDVAKHKDEAPIPHDSDPLPDDSTPFTALSRVVRATSFIFTSLLAGASLPGASMMLAGETPSGHTLRAAWVMSVCGATAMIAAMLRHMAPFLSLRMTVFREECRDGPAPRMTPPLAVLAVCDAAVFGAAVVAACRPLSSVTLTPVRRSALFAYRKSPELPPPAAPPYPMPPYPLPPPNTMAWLDDTMLQRVAAYGDTERDAMAVIALLAGLACNSWLILAYLASSSERVARLRVVAVALGVLGCSLQGQLLGTVMPNIGVTNNTARYARNVAAGAPGATVVWMQDPLGGVITVFIAMAAAVTLVTCVVSRV